MSGAWQRKEGKNCSCCQEYFQLSGFYTTGKRVDGSPKYQSWCKNCISTKMKSYHKKTWGKDKLTYVNFKRTKSLRSYLTYLRSKAIGRKKSCVSIDDLVELFNNQNGKCALTGWDMTMVLGEGVVNTNASIDRIDSSKGYETDNIQFVCRIVNTAKSDLPQEDFINLCKTIIDNQNGIPNKRVAA
jgi:hypothetical protein